MMEIPPFWLRRFPCHLPDFTGEIPANDYVPGQIMMKFCKNLPGRLSLISAILAVLVLGLGRGEALAQVPGNDSAILYVMVKLYASHPAFSARAEMRVLDKNKKETDFMPMNFALLDGRWRMDIDVSQIRSSEMPAQLIPSLKLMGMDQMDVIMRPDEKIILSCYPRMKAYVETSMTLQEEAAVSRNFKIERTHIGRETVDGHPCEKEKVTLTDTGKKAQRYEATVWSATDLKNFPVQVEIHEEDSTILMKFKDVKQGNPGASRFTAPAGLTKYTDATKLLQDASAKISGGNK